LESFPGTRAIEIEFVFGGSIVLHRRFLLSLVVALSLSTLASANSANVNMTFLYPGTNVSGGYYTYPYYFSINGGKATPMMCDSFNNHITVGESWKANVSGLLSGKGLFGKDIRDYKAAGIIFMGVVNGTIDAKTGNWAVWNLFVKGVTTDAAVLALDSNALFLAKHAPASEFKGLVLYTAVGSSAGHGPQEFIGYRGTPMATPEPGSLMLLSTGLIGIAGVLRRKLLRA
jgi:PEP-CTERM motif